MKWDWLQWVEFALRLAIVAGCLVAVGLLVCWTGCAGPPDVGMRTEVGGWGLEGPTVYVTTGAEHFP